MGAPLNCCRFPEEPVAGGFFPRGCFLGSEDRSLLTFHRPMQLAVVHSIAPEQGYTIGSPARLFAHSALRLPVQRTPSTLAYWAWTQHRATFVIGINSEPFGDLRWSPMATFCGVPGFLRVSSHGSARGSW